MTLYLMTNFVVSQLQLYARMMLTELLIVVQGMQFL